MEGVGLIRMLVSAVSKYGQKGGIGCSNGCYGYHTGINSLSSGQLFKYEFAEFYKGDCSVLYKIRC